MGLWPSSWVYGRFWLTRGCWGGGPSSGRNSRPGRRRTVVRRFRGLMSPFSPSLDSARDRRAQGLVACVVCFLLGLGVKSGTQIGTRSRENAPLSPSLLCSEAAVERPGEAGSASRCFSVCVSFCLGSLVFVSHLPLAFLNFLYVLQGMNKL